MKAGEPQWVFDILDTLYSPVIVHGHQWGDMTPDWLIKEIPMHRMIFLMKNQELATYHEALAYLHPLSLEGPLHGDWADIYLFLGGVTMKEKMIEAEIYVESITAYQRDYLLRPLQRQIYEKRRALLKDRMKAERKTLQVPDNPEEHLNTKLEVVSQQLSFDF